MTVVELRPTPTRPKAKWPSVLVALGYLCAAAVLLHGIWADPNGQNPLFSTLMNHPLGVNLMANTAMFGLSIPLIPVTIWLGSGVTWALILTLGLAGTAFAWYWMFSRRLASAPAAAVGGLFCGFAPAMISLPLDLKRICSTGTRTRSSYNLIMSACEPAWTGSSGEARSSAACGSGG